MSTSDFVVPPPEQLLRWYEVAKASHVHSPEEDLARLKAAVAEGRPICQYCSPDGFSQTTDLWQQLIVVPTLEAMGVTVIRNWGYNTGRLDVSTGQRKREVSGQLAVLHREGVRVCDFLLVNLNGEPPDGGTVVEGIIGNESGIPAIALRDDFRTSSGEADNPYNLMLMLIAYIGEHGGFHVDSWTELVERLPGFLQSLKLRGPRPEAFERWMKARTAFEQGGLFPVL